MDPRRGPGRTARDGGVTAAAALVAAALFAVMGAAALVRPAAVFAPFGVAAATPDIRNEIRAVYGGFGLAMAALLGASLALPAFASGIRLTAGAALLGMAAGRMVGFAVERAGRWPVTFAAVEVALGAALVATVLR